MLAAYDVATLAVRVLPLSPKLTPLLFEKRTELRLLLVVPAEKLILPDGALAPEIVTEAPF